MKKLILIGIIAILIASAGLVLAQGGGKGKSSIEWCLLTLPSGKEIKIPCKIAEHLPPGLPITIVAKIIDSCPYIIDESGNYVLAKDLEATDYCIRIRPPKGEYSISNVSLNCRGYKIIGPGITGSWSNFGIRIENGYNTVVKNCQVSDFDSGIGTSEARYIDIVDNIVENTRSGIGVGRDSNHRIIGNIVRNNSQKGISLGFGSDDALVQANKVHDNSIGIFLDGVACEDNKIAYNVVFNNKVGIKFGRGDSVPWWASYEGNEVEGNYVCGNTSYDFWCSCVEEKTGVCLMYYPVIDNGGNICNNPNDCAISCLACEWASLTRWFEGIE